MKEFFKVFLLASLCLCVFGTAMVSAAPKKDKAIVAVSFGTTFDEARTNDIGGIENALKAAFPNRDFYRAFTSYIVMERLEKNKGIKVQDLPNVLEQLKKDGYKDILIQPTHLLHGEEFEIKVMPTVKKFQKQFDRVIVGNPLMTNDEDFAIAASAVATQFPILKKGEGIVLMGHGSPRNNNKSFGRTYNILQKCFDDIGLPVVVGVVEEVDSPNVHAVLELVKARGYKTVHMFPLMIVAGDHAHNDMYGSEEDSWKTLIEAMGVKTISHMGGIGRNVAIQNIYVQHAVAAEAQGTTY
ncbi:MAG: sirohydrochlorin cobaltochelatase [Acidaminococcaceae bacterium]